MKKRALLLFSEGLDSILAGKLLKAQDIEIVALRFITPFFGWKWKGKEKDFDFYVREEFGFEAGVLEDITPNYLKMLAAPPHGYGSQFNPCIDCKVLMLRLAKEKLSETGASFLVTGEVVGQRPMSQMRNMLRHLEKEAGVEELLLRPLSARKLPETRPEREGLVLRDRLLDISGRGRKRQLALARELGLRHIPSPAGGCLLTDPSLAPRLRRYFEIKDGKVTPLEAEILTFGRHFELSGGSWLVMGRQERENRRLLELVAPGSLLLKIKDIPGPLGYLMLEKDQKDLPEAARLLKKYAPKARGLEKVKVLLFRKGEEQKETLEI